MKRKSIPVIGIILVSFVTASHGQKSFPSYKIDFLADNIDSTISPSKDFYQFANGKWKPGTTVEQEINILLRKITEDAAAMNAAEGTIEQKIGDFWFTGMDSVTIEKQGFEPLQPYLNKIDNIKSSNDLIDVVAIFHSMRMINIMFTGFIGTNPKNTDMMEYTLTQSGLGMPSNDFYFNNNQQSINVRKAYKQQLFKTFKQLGSDSLKATELTNAVYDLETRLATAGNLTDLQKRNGKISIVELQNLAGNIAWRRFLTGIGLNQLDSVIMSHTDFFIELNKELATTSLETWKNYLRFRFIKILAPFLDDATFNNDFEVRKALRGFSHPPPRDERVLAAVGGEAQAQLIVKELFGEKAKKRYINLAKELRDAYAERIKKLEWMSGSTKQKALEKLFGMTFKIGYPDKWRDFSSLKIARDAYVLNAIRSREWLHQYQIKKLGKPADRTEWNMGIYMNQNIYNWNFNEIVVEAGIFIIPGMKDEELDDAFVYGFSGAYIAHEITHGFDRVEITTDAKGNLANWWTKRDSVEFRKRAKLIIQQFNEFNPIDTFHVDGERTQNENIADLGGLLIALDAIKKTTAYAENKKIGGLTPLQRFFLGFAYRYKSLRTKQFLINQILSDLHAPGKERVNGALVNIPEFYGAFNIKPGDKMYRPESLRVKIW